MDILQVILRILHIIFGVSWAGALFFNVLVLEPRLRRLGPAIQNPVMGSLMPVMIPFMLVSALVTIVSGVAMTLILRWGALDTLFVTGWGWSMIISFITTIAAAIIGFGVVIPTGRRLAALAGSLQGRPPTPEEAQQLGGLSARITTLTRINFVLLLSAVVTMAIARFV